MNTLDELALKVAKDMYRLSAPAYQHEILEFAHRLVAELAKQKCHGTETLCSTCNNDFRKCVMFAAPVIPAGTSAWCLGYKEVPK